MYLGKEYTEEQINEMDCANVNTLLNRYESVLSAQMTKSLGKSIINLYSNITCSVLGVGNQQELSTDLECDPFLNTAMQRFTCDLYYRFGALLAPVSIGIAYKVEHDKAIEDLQRAQMEWARKRQERLDYINNQIMKQRKAEKRFADLNSASNSISLGKHYAKNSITKLNDRSDNGTCDPATRNRNLTEEPSES